MHDSGEAPTDRARRTRAVRWLARYPRATPLAIFLAIAMITGLSVIAIEEGEDQRDRAIMREVAQSVESALYRRASIAAAYLRAGSALFASTGDVSQPLFRRFASELGIDADLRASEVIGWAEVVRLDQLEAFERAVSAERGATFSVRREPGAAGDILAPVTFLKPDTERSRRIIGYDLYSAPACRAAMNEAARLMQPTATGKLILAQDEYGEATGFLIFMPVLEAGQGDRRIKGFIYSPFDAQQFLSSEMESSAHRHMGVRLYDGTADPANLLAEHAPAVTSGKIMRQQISIANRPLVVEIDSARSGSLSPLSMATLLFGLAVASLLMMLARLLTRQAIEDEASLAFFEEQNSIRNSLTRELNHRVKNTLASILSIIALTRRRTNDLDEFAEGLEGRVRALSATHDLLTQSDWGTTPIRSVIEAEMAPYSGGDAEISLEGPEVELAPNDALSLGLAVHELTTNAAKYGALSQPGGRVAISWERESEEMVVVRWQERGGPPVSADRKRGFGTDLIEKIVAHELRQPVDLRFEPEGVSCKLRVPVRVRGRFQIRERLDRLSD